MRTISKSTLIQPSSLVCLYFMVLSLTFLFVDQAGQTTLLDELFLMAIFPVGLIGLYKNFFSIGLPARLITTYFIASAVSSFAILASRDDIPFAAPLLGLLLDMKFVIFLGALLYLSRRSKKNCDEKIVALCKVIVFIAFLNSIFFLRDIFIGGNSLSGISLSKNNIYGYIPIGLFPHKLYAAAICALALISTVTLYLMRNKQKYLWASVFFACLLILSSSLKELAVILAILLMALASLRKKSRSATSRAINFYLVGFIVLPTFFFLFGAELEYLISNRINIYLIEENTRAALHIKSVQIASDYFPLGSGAGTFSSQPSRSIYFSPIYYEYGMNMFYGASEENSSYLMDSGWPKFLAEAGWIGGLSYFLAYLISLFSLLVSFLKRPTAVNTFGVLVGTLVFSSALGSAVFTSDIGLALCALLFFCGYLDKIYRYAPVIRTPQSNRQHRIKSGLM